MILDGGDYTTKTVLWEISHMAVVVRAAPALARVLLIITCGLYH
jgi:hypothetical protein